MHLRKRKLRKYISSACRDVHYHHRLYISIRSIDVENAGIWYYYLQFIFRCYAKVMRKLYDDTIATIDARDRSFLNMQYLIFLLNLQNTRECFIFVTRKSHYHNRTRVDYSHMFGVLMFKARRAFSKCKCAGHSSSPSSSLPICLSLSPSVSFFLPQVKLDLAE